MRIWLTNHVDFSKPVNQMTAGGLTFTGIALGSIAALLVYHGMRLLGYRNATERRDVVAPEPEHR